MKTLLVPILLMLNLGIHAQRPGDLNTDFADSGIYMEDWMDTTTVPYDIAVLADGTMIITGCYQSTETDLYQIMAQKLGETGNLVPFGNFPHGFEYDLSSREYASSVLVLPDNKTLIAGTYSIAYPDKHPFVLRLDTDGNLDETFGEGGVYVNESNHMELISMAIYQQEGSYSIILGGSNSNLSRNPLLMMISDEGELVTEFGTDGLLELGDFTGQLNDLIVDSANNKLYLCGTISDDGSILGKFNLPDGSPDTDYSEDGVLGFTTEDSKCSLMSMILDKNDTTLTIFGHYPFTEEDQDIFAIRLHADDATADESFGFNGISTIQSPASDDYINSAILQSDGKYYFAGRTNLEGTDDFMLGRINHNGFGDTTFGVNGFVINVLEQVEAICKIALSPEEDVLYALGINMDELHNTSTILAAYHTKQNTEPIIGIVECGIEAIHLSPNPAIDFVSVESLTAGSHQIQVFDLAGKELIKRKFTGENYELDLSMLQPSIYLIRVTLPDGQVTTSKLVKN